MLKKRARTVEEGLAGEGEPPKKKSSKQPLLALEKLLQEEDSILAGLTLFLNTVTESYKATAETGTDLISGYLNQHPECQHLVAPLQWERDKRTYNVLLLCLKCLEQVLLFTAAPPTSATPTEAKSYRTAGCRLVQKLFSSHMKCVYHCLLSSVPTKLVVACLKLLAAMVMQGADSAKEVQLTFNFGYKPLGTFASKTSPISDSSTGNSESIRQSFMKFSLAFLIVGDGSVISAVLEQKGFLSSFFKLLPKDDVPTLHMFLMTILEKVVMNPAVSKKSKSQFFNQFALKHLAMLLDQSSGRAASEDGTGHVQELAARLLDVLCTDCQFGICYKSKDIPAGLERTNNPVLLHFLLSLSGQLRDLSVQDFIIRTLKCCPDLLITYLQSVGINFEPQPSSEWVVNMAYLIKIFKEFTSVPVLLSGGRNEEEEGKNVGGIDLPPSLVGVAVSLTLPCAVTRSHFSLGLQHPLPLVKYYTLQLINVVLKRAGGVVNTWGPVNRNLKSISSFLVQYCDSVLKCLPDIRTVIALRQRLQLPVYDGGKGGGKEAATASMEMKNLMPEDVLKNKDLSQDSSVLTSLTLSVLCGLQHLSPDILSQVNFSPAKLLPPFPPGEVKGQEVCLALQINLDAGGENLSQSCDTLATVLSLVQSSNDKISGLARCLFHKMSGFSVVDSDCLLTSCVASSTHPDVAADVVKLAAAAVSRSLLERGRLEEEVRSVLGEDTARHGPLTLQEILALPETDFTSTARESTSDVESEVRGSGSDVGSEVRGSGRYGRLVLAASVYKEFSKFKNDSLLPFVHHFLLCLLTSDPQDYQCLSTLTLHYLPHTQHPFTLTTAQSRSSPDQASNGSPESSAAHKFPGGNSLAVMLSCLGVDHSKIPSEPSPIQEEKKMLTVSASPLSRLLETGDADQFLSTLRKSKFISCQDLFIDVMRLSCDHRTKECLVELLISSVELNPSVCKTSHVLAFLGAYSATRSIADQGLLYLISKYEECGMTAGELSPFLWGAAALERHSSGQSVYWSPPDISDVLKLLDTHTLLRTASGFSVKLKLEPQNPFLRASDGAIAEDQTLYDPCFLLPLFSHYLGKDAHVDCRSVVAHGVLGFLITALTSTHRDVRLAACHCLTGFKGYLEDSRFREKPQIVLLMDVLQNTMEKDCSRLSSVFASFAAKASLLFLHADDSVYPVVSRYTVHKPALDLRKVPLFYTMLHSSSSQCANERLWLLKVLVDGLRCREDYRFYKRYQVFSHVACLASSEMLGKEAKELAEQVLQRGLVTCEEQ